MVPLQCFFIHCTAVGSRWFSVLNSQCPPSRCMPRQWCPCQIRTHWPWTMARSERYALTQYGLTEIGRGDAKSWTSVQTEVQTINLPTFNELSSDFSAEFWGVGQMARGHQKCTPMCTRSWSGSQKSYPDLVRCPGHIIVVGKCSTNTNPRVGHSTADFNCRFHRTLAFAILRCRLMTIIYIYTYVYEFQRKTNFKDHNDHSHSMPQPFIRH